MYAVACCFCLVLGGGSAYMYLSRRLILAEKKARQKEKEVKKLEEELKTTREQLKDLQQQPPQAAARQQPQAVLLLQVLHQPAAAVGAAPAGSAERLN
jgi:cell division protein FtsB